MTVQDSMKYFGSWPNWGINTTELIFIKLYPTNFSGHDSTQSFLQMLNFSVKAWEKVSIISRHREGCDIY